MSDTVSSDSIEVCIPVITPTSTHINQNATTIPNLEEQLTKLKNKFLEDFEKISNVVHSLDKNNCETPVETNVPTKVETPSEIKVDKTNDMPFNSKIDEIPIIDVTCISNTCLDCSFNYKEFIIKFILKCIENVLRFIIEIGSQLVKIIPIAIIFYRISKLFTPVIPPRPIVV